MYFVIRKAKNGEFWWRAVGDNNKVMAHSETMVAKQSCEDAIATIKREAARAETLDKTGEDPTNPS